MIIIIDSYIGFTHPIELTLFMKGEFNISLKKAREIRHNIVDIENYEINIEDEQSALRMFHKLKEVGVTCHVK